jgi:hypothetical protein
MALQIEFETATGEVYSNSYWRIVQLNFDVNFKEAHITLHGYVNEDARDNNKLHFDERHYIVKNGKAFAGEEQTYDITFGQDVLEVQGVNPAIKAYAYIKAQDEFNNAVDV